jgi:hypothetical protein
VRYNFVSDCSGFRNKSFGFVSDVCFVRKMGVPAFFRWLSRKYTSVIVPCIEEKVCYFMRLTYGALVFVHY